MPTVQLPAQHRPLVDACRRQRIEGNIAAAGGGEDESPMYLLTLLDALRTTTFERPHSPYTPRRITVAAAFLPRAKCAELAPRDPARISHPSYELPYVLHRPMHCPMDSTGRVDTRQCRKSRCPLQTGAFSLTVSQLTTDRSTPNQLGARPVARPGTDPDPDPCVQPYTPPTRAIPRAPPPYVPMNQYYTSPQPTSLQYRLAPTSTPATYYPTQYPRQSVVQAPPYSPNPITASNTTRTSMASNLLAITTPAPQQSSPMHVDVQWTNVHSAQLLKNSEYAPRMAAEC
ncbi:hypothetical protein B0H12DRAFT_1071256 [Mycena haematopus]|nr:hypothetical protein B0H12DRAFT_1071256 [Mycena haematopus]